MDTALVVVQPFNSYVVGDLITDSKLSHEIVSGEHARNVVRIALVESSSQRRPFLAPPARAANTEER